MSFSKSEYMLKYQKAKAKLFEYNVPKENYPNFRLNYRDLAFPTILCISQFSEAVIDGDLEKVAIIKKSLYYCSEFYDAAMKSREQIQHDLDFLLTGAIAYFFEEKYGSAMVLISETHNYNIPIDMRGILVEIFNITFWGKTYAGIDDLVIKEYKKYVKGSDSENVLKLVKEKCELSYKNNEEVDAFFAEALYAIIKLCIKNSASLLLPAYSGVSNIKWESYFQKKTSIKMLWPAQKLIGEKGLLKGKNSIVQLPTGVGKTKSIELIIRSMFLSERGENALIVAPLRALCNEITDDMRKSFQGEATINLFSDLLELDFLDIFSKENEKRIFICTPEKLQFIFHHQPEVIGYINLFVFDEGHMFDDMNRGAMYELLISDIKRHLTQQQQLVILSAVLSNADKILEWIMGDKGVLAFDKNIKSTSKAVGFISSENTIHYFSDSFNEEDFYIPEVVKSIKLESIRKNAKPKFFPEKKANDIALYYTNLLCKNGGVAIYMSQRRFVSTILGRLVEVKSKGFNFENVIENSNQQELHKLSHLIKEYYGDDSIYYAAANIGILPHYSSLPNGLRNSVEYAFRKREIVAVVCTSTLAQGVNIPIKYLIMTSLRSAKDIMSTRNFQNLMGRTARAGVYTEGSVLISDPRLFDERKSGKGYYTWKDTTELFDSKNSEACGSAILRIVQDFHIDYETIVYGETVCDFIAEHINEEWDETIKVALYKFLTTENKDTKLNRQNISNRISEYKKIVSTIENGICYGVFCRMGEEKRLVEIIHEETENIYNDSLAFFISTDEEKILLKKIFYALEERIVKNSTIITKVSKAMVDIDFAQKILDIINKKNLNTVNYNSDELLAFVLELFNSIHTDNVLGFELCKSWVDGDSYKTMEDEFELNILTIEKMCGQNISFELSFLIGNVIDYLDSESVNIETLQLLQKQVKYGVRTDTEISICEKIFNDRIIANIITNELGNTGIKEDNILECIKYHHEEISNLLEEFPSYFNNRISFLINNK